MPVEDHDRIRTIGWMLKRDGGDDSGRRWDSLHEIDPEAPRGIGRDVGTLGPGEIRRLASAVRAGAQKGGR